MMLRILQTAAVAALALIGGACGGGDPTPSPTAGPTDRTAAATPRATGTDTPAPEAKGWRTLAPMPTPRSEVAVAAVGGKIYVVGGFERDGSTSDAVEVYDPATDTWTQAPPLPEPRHHTAAVGLDTLLYVIGGFASNFEDPQATVFEFSEASGWIERPSLEGPRGAHGVVHIGRDEILVLGGVGADGSNLATTEIYDIRAGISREVASIPTPRDHLGVSNAYYMDGIKLLRRVQAIGGRRNVDFGQNLNANEEYDPQADVWTTRAPLPTARSGIAAVVIAKPPPDTGRIHVFGGEGSEGTFDEHEVYHPQTDTWETLEPMPTARHGLGAAVVGDTIFVIGGGETPGLSVSGVNEAFTP